MENEMIINGKRCRYHSGLWFADTGDFVAEYNNDSGCYESCTIYPTVNLGACVEEMFYEETLDEVVAELFGPPYPHDGKTYDLIHKDGDEMNCDYRNLEWMAMEQIPQRPYHYNNSTAPMEYVRYYHWILEVSQAGTIKQHGEVLEPYDFDSVLYDKYGDTLDFEFFVDVGYYMVHVEQLMAWAGYVQGDDAGLKTPVILHRDGDYKNFNSNNLEWVEMTDPRFISYMKKKEQARQTRIKELIEQKQLPLDWDKSESAKNTPFLQSAASFTPPHFGSFGKGSR